MSKVSLQARQHSSSSVLRFGNKLEIRSDSGFSALCSFQTRNVSPALPPWGYSIVRVVVNAANVNGPFLVEEALT